jgi:hypothetical protein
MSLTSKKRKEHKLMNTPTSSAVFTVVVIEPVTQRVWYEVTAVTAAEAALAAYQHGHGSETDHKMISIDVSEIEPIDQEEQDALSMD